MDKVLSILVLIIIIGIIIIGEIYLKMDRNRAIAITLLKRIDFTDWLDTISAMFAACPPEWLEAYSPLKSEYDSAGSRHILKKVSILNEMRSLAKKAVSDNLDNARVVALAEQLTDDFMTFADLQLGYNDCVYKVNHALEGGASQAVGKLFRVHRLDKLSELTVL